jgi:hypothetical protein
MSNKYNGYAAVLQTTISSVLTNIAGVRDISGPSLSQDTIEVSSRDSIWKEYVGGQVDGGEITFDIVYDPDTPTHLAGTAGGLVKDLMAGTLQAFKLKFADTTPATATFSALVTKFTPKAPYNGMQAADVTLKISGAITWA